MRVTTLSLPLRQVADASWRALADLDSPNTWVLAFSAPELASSAEGLRRLKAALPLSHLTGCSTAGEIHGTSLSDGTVSLAVTRFESATLRSTLTPVAHVEDSRRAGATLGGELRDESLRAVFLLSDGLHVNGSELVKGLNEMLPNDVVVTGGLAGDGSSFRHTWIVKPDGELAAGFVSAIGIYGRAALIGHGSKGGWEALGPERVVTKSAGNVLYELDGAPALDLYMKYLGARAVGLPATALLFPLSLRAPDGQEAQGGSVVRTILGVDHQNKSLTFAGDIPWGSVVRLMRATSERLVGGAAQAAAEIVQEGAVGPQLSVAVSCVGRRLVLGQRTEEELEVTLKPLAPDTQQIGFYSYGELSPSSSSAGPCELHNQTMTLTTFAERR